MLNRLRKYEAPKRSLSGLASDDEQTLCVNTIRCLSASAVTEANSGHPGAPLGCAPMAHVLFAQMMNFAPKNPKWIARDRFVLSNGHASALQYTMLFLLGLLELDDLKQFRQLNSRTPGHPENITTPCIEVTTGPLGQGIAQAVGLAIAAMNARMRCGELMNSRIYVMCGDGCLNEGVSLEAIALAGNLKLANLTLLYDRNGITIDGCTDLAFNEDIGLLFEGFGWSVEHVSHGDSDLVGIRNAIALSKCSVKPSLIVVDTTIGFGSQLEGTNKVHGSPLKREQLDALRRSMGFTSDDLFEVPTIVQEVYQKRVSELNAQYDSWQVNCNKVMNEDTDAGRFMMHLQEINAKDDVLNKLREISASIPENSGRDASEYVLKQIAPLMPTLIGGSADLMDSTKTSIIDCVEGTFRHGNYFGRYIHFGIREHAMVAICNGIAAFGGYQPFCATFLNFYGYAAGAVRLSALSHLPVLMIATHDSVELGEDGPTHQPIEAMAHFRALPNFSLIRPGDAREVVGAYMAWQLARTRPTLLALSRGKLINVENTQSKKVLLGAYVLEEFISDCPQRKIILAASGSQLSVAAVTRNILRKNFNVRLVSFPSWDLFAAQPNDYKESVFPADISAAIMEPYASYGLDRYFDLRLSVFLDRFGLSAPEKKINEALGLNAENWAKRISSVLIN